MKKENEPTGTEEQPKPLQTPEDPTILAPQGDEDGGEGEGDGNDDTGSTPPGGPPTGNPPGTGKP